MLMKWSRFNHITKSSKYGNFIFNSVTNSFVKVENELLDKLMNVQNWNIELNSIDEPLQSMLVNHRIIVPDHYDEDIIRQKKYLKAVSSFNTNYVGLTVATTTACNFKCPYCYEEGVVANNMSIEVESAILSHIKSIHKPVEITWYGGEPLMNWLTIERITTALSAMRNDVDYILITNGYLLTPEKCDFFANVKLKHIQITIDGLECTHNKTRILKNNAGSYSTIMNNIDYALKALPNTFISIRVNIGHHNKEEYPKLRNEIYTRWKDYRCNIGVHFAFIVDYQGCSPNCLSTCQRLEYISELFHSHNIISRDIIPENNTGICCANKYDSFVIGPDGFLYKCWVDIGKKDKIVGTIFDLPKISNLKILSDYYGEDKYSSQKCLNCFMLPLCGGLCPAAKSTLPQNDQCPYNNKYFDDVLEMYYEILVSAQDPESDLVKNKKILLNGNK